MTLVKDEPLEKKKLFQQHCICKPEVLGKERELLTAGQLLVLYLAAVIWAGNENKIYVRESKKKRRKKVKIGKNVFKG